MIINSSESNLNFDDFWCELPSILGPGKIVGRYYGRPIIIKRIKISYVSVDSPDSGGEIDIPVEYFKEVCGDWRSYKYEKLSGDNPKSTLDVISIVSYVIQTWVRRSERDKLIEKACCAGIPDGAFWIVDYNHYSRLIGPNPAGEIISLGDVFPDEDREDLAEVE